MFPQISTKMKKNYLRISTIILSSLIVTGVSSCKKKDQKSNDYEAWDMKMMDTTANPGDDFYRYANGGWLDKNEVPADQSRWGTFYELRKENEKKIESILKEYSSKPYPEGTNEQKIGDFYYSGMDTNTIEKLGYTPISPMLTQIDQIKNLDDLSKFMGTLQKGGSNAPLYIYVDADLKNSQVNSLYFYQGGLGMPDRDYYLDPNPKFQTYRDAYKQLINNLFTLAGFDPGKDNYADEIFNLEKELAIASMPNEQLRDPANTYNPSTYEEFKKNYSKINWDLWFQGAGFEAPENFIVSTPSYFKGLNSILGKTNINTLKNYLKWQIINGYAELLNHDFVVAHFNFYSKTLNGVEQMKPRSEKVSNYASQYLGEVLGQIYVKKHFPEDAKKKADELVKNVTKAFEIRIKNLSWMGDSTKEKALFKLSKIIPKIGYPDKWKDYSSYKVNRGDFLQNIIGGSVFEYQLMINKIGKAVDKTEWAMTPQTVNAYYNPSINEIVFPAGILQPPFFDPKADDAINYGAIGAVIGHELTHGFDDQGAKFDANGNFENWWTEVDNQKFAERTKALVEQYDSYTVLDSFHVNGSLTLGENIADLGGISIAYDALQMALSGKESTKIQGFTPQQRVFLAWARVWCGKAKNDALINQIKTDPHSPGMFRAVGPLVNLDSFYEAFGIKEGSKLYKKPEDRIRIW